jgi:hypothetical protein
MNFCQEQVLDYFRRLRLQSVGRWCLSNLGKCRNAGCSEEREEHGPEKGRRRILALEGKEGKLLSLEGGQGLEADSRG